MRVVNEWFGLVVFKDELPIRLLWRDDVLYWRAIVNTVVSTALERVVVVNSVLARRARLDDVMVNFLELLKLGVGPLKLV